jgi:hypothetical protein
MDITRVHVRAPEIGRGPVRGKFPVFFSGGKDASSGRDGGVFW